MSGDTAPRRRARRPRPAPGVASTQTHTFWLTSAVDLREHAVTDADFEAGVLAGQGIYQAMCGTTVPPCPMVTPPGPPCPDCPSSEDYHAQRVARRLAEHRRRNRWWRRLARRVRRG